MRFLPTPRLIAVVVATVALFSIAVSRADELSEASKLLRAGQHTLALQRVDVVLARHPNDPRARFMQGLIFAEQGKADAAIEVFRKLTQDFPELPEPHNNLAVIYASQGQYEKARVALEQSIRTHPSYATAYENLGDVYAKLASQAYDRALKLDSSNAGAQNKLALVRDLVSGAGVAEATASEVRAAPPVAASAAAAASPAPAAREAPVASAAPVAGAPLAAPARLAAAAASVPAPPPAPPRQAGPGEVLEAVEAWARAWSRQDVDAYLAAYARDFQPGGGQSRDAWEKMRRDRVSAPGSIRVAIDQARVRRGAENRAQVTFRQEYRSDRFQATSTKTLVMEKAENGAWRIVEERVGR